MKKFCAILSVIILIFSVGCQKENISQEKNVAPPLSVYTANLDVTFGEIKMNALLTKHSENKYEIQMLSPEIMKPLNLIYENGLCTVTYDGLKFETDFKRFPQAEFGALLTHALSDTDGGMITQSSSDGIITYKGITDYGDFILTQDAKTGLWKEFKIEGASLHIIFNDFQTN